MGRTRDVGQALKPPFGRQRPWDFGGRRGGWTWTWSPKGVLAFEEWVEERGPKPQRKGSRVSGERGATVLGKPPRPQGLSGALLTSVFLQCFCWLAAVFYTCYSVSFAETEVGRAETRAFESQACQRPKPRF